MAPKVVHICGPERGGKTTIARLIARGCHGPSAALVRFEPQPQGGTDAAMSAEPPEDWATRFRFRYAPDRLFEQVPLAVRDVGPTGRAGLILLETNADPGFRLAHPYDLRVFVMGVPRFVDEVFRSPDETQDALRRAFQDTGAFASEVFGLTRAPDLDDSRSGLILGTLSETRRPLSDEELEQVMTTALGSEISARLRLRPGYHALLDADVAVLNCGLGGAGETIEVCSRRIERLITAMPQGARPRPRFFSCDPLDPHDPLTVQLFGAILAGLAGAGAGRA